MNTYPFYRQLCLCLPLSLKLINLPLLSDFQIVSNTNNAFYKLIGFFYETLFDLTSKNPYTATNSLEFKDKLKHISNSNFLCFICKIPFYKCSCPRGFRLFGKRLGEYPFSSIEIHELLQFVYQITTFVFNDVFFSLIEGMGMEIYSF